MVKHPFHLLIILNRSLARISVRVRSPRQSLIRKLSTVKVRSRTATSKTVLWCAVTAAQAAHWFDHERFHTEVRRVLKPGGLLALWTYGVHTINEEIDEVVQRLYKDITGPYWPARRKIVENSYADLPFPFPKIETPHFEMVSDWSLDSFYGYLGTWSGSNYYMKEHGVDPRGLVIDDLRSAWGDPQTKRKVIFPLTVIAGFNS